MVVFNFIQIEVPWKKNIYEKIYYLSNIIIAFFYYFEL